MHCKFCGTKIDEDSVFCSNCGKSLKNQQPPVTPLTDIVNEKIILEEPPKNVVRPQKVFLSLRQ